MAFTPEEQLKRYETALNRIEMLTKNNSLKVSQECHLTAVWALYSNASICEFIKEILKDVRATPGIIATINTDNDNKDSTQHGS